MKADLLRAHKNWPKHVQTSMHKVAELCAVDFDSIKRRGDVTAGQLVATRSAYLTHARGLNTNDDQTDTLIEVRPWPRTVIQTADDRAGGAGGLRAESDADAEGSRCSASRHPNARTDSSGRAARCERICAPKSDERIRGEAGGAPKGLGTGPYRPSGPYKPPSSSPQLGVLKSSARCVMTARLRRVTMCHKWTAKTLAWQS